MRCRRSPPVDPDVLARVVALLDAGGWTPPAGGDPQPSVPAGADPHPSVPAGEPAWPSSLPADVPPSDEVEHWSVAGPAWQETAERSPGGERAEPATEPAGAGQRSALDRWRTGRLDPGRRGVAALALVAVLAAGLAAVVVLRSRPQEVAVPASVQLGRPVPGAVGGSSGSGRPLPSGRPVAAGSPRTWGGRRGRRQGPPSRPRPPACRQPRRRRGAGCRWSPTPRRPGAGQHRPAPVDGEQVLVGVTAAPPPADGSGSAAAGAGGGAPGAAGAAAGPVDLNAATVSQLDGLPGIGPVLAQRIIDWRTEHGRFGSVDQLREVSGIGESKFDSLRSKVAV